MGPIRILLMTLDPAVLERFRNLLGQQEEIEIVAAPTTVAEGLQQAEQLRPDLVLLDYDLVKAAPDPAAGDLIRQFVKIPGPAKVLVLWEHMEALLLRDIMISGASWAIDKDEPLEDMLSTIRLKAAVDSRERDLYTPVITGFWSGEIPPDANLTPREREILKLVDQGKSDKQIAALLGISEKSLASCWSIIRLKLMPKNRPDFNSSVN